MNKDTIEDELAEVHTGNGFHADLEATQSKRIKLTVQHLKQLEILTERLIEEQQLSVQTAKELVKVTEIQGIESEILQRRVYWLTWATVALAIVQVIIAIVK